MSKAVIQVTQDNAEIEKAVASAERVRERMPDLEVQIVVHGDALDDVVGTAPLEHDPAIVVAACRSGLEARGRSVDELRPGFTTVPAGAAAIIQAQLDGAAYLRL